MVGEGCAYNQSKSIELWQLPRSYHSLERFYLPKKKKDVVEICNVETKAKWVIKYTHLPCE